jgi:hypothetical protein
MLENLKNKRMETFLDEYDELKLGNPDYQELSDHNFFFKLNNLNLFNVHIKQKLLDMKKI